MRAQEFLETDLGVSPRRSARLGARHRRGHEPVLQYHVVKETHNEFVVARVDPAFDYSQVLDQFGDTIEWSGNYMVVPSNYWSNVKELITDLGGQANEVEHEQLNELMFMNMSPCKTDCSGHRAGYKWSKDRGGVSTASWSDSFNRGAEIAKAGY